MHDIKFAIMKVLTKVVMQKMMLNHSANSIRNSGYPICHENYTYNTPLEHTTQ